MQLAPYRPAQLTRRATWKPAAMRGPFQMGQNVADGLGVGDVMSPIFVIGVSSVIAYVGFHTAINQKGALSALGWVAGIAGALSSLFTLSGLLLMGATPTSALEPQVVVLPPSPPTATPAGPMDF